MTKNHHVLDELPGQPEIAVEPHSAEDYALQSIGRLPTGIPQVVRMRVQQLAYELHRERQITSAMIDIEPGNGRHMAASLD